MYPGKTKATAPRQANQDLGSNPCSVACVRSAFPAVPEIVTDAPTAPVQGGGGGGAGQGFWGGGGLHPNHESEVGAAMQHQSVPSGSRGWETYLGIHQDKGALVRPWRWGTFLRLALLASGADGQDREDEEGCGTVHRCTYTDRQNFT